MNDYSLSPDALADLRAAHRQTREKREADRIKAVFLLAMGWRAEDIGEARLIDPNTVRNHFKRYQEGGIEALREFLYRGSAPQLDEEQLAELDAHLEEHLYQTAKAVANWVKEQFGVEYTDSGMTALLHRLGYVYKKPHAVPSKADPEAQRAFLEQYEQLKQDKNPDDPIYFMDAVHPQHNPVIACGWIKRGEDHDLPTNTGRKRVNINGAVELDRLEPVVRFDETINAEATMALFQELERRNLTAVVIYT